MIFVTFGSGFRVTDVAVLGYGVSVAARFAPPLIVTREELDWALERIVAALGEYGPVYEKAA